jgi:hypothetical protein
MHPYRCSCNKIALFLIDGQTVIFAIKGNVNDMLILHGHLLATLVSAFLLFALPFLSVKPGHGLS